MKWSILILTLPGRERFLARLQAVLRPQVEGHDDVEVLVRVSDPQLDLGTNRQRMIESSSAEYISQIDDDDLVAQNYVPKILPLLDRDYVGFQLQMFIDGQKQKPTYHSLRYKEWNADADGFYRDISHVNPIRRELALAVPMAGGFGEDERWSNGMRQLGIVKTEHYVDEPMYFYYFRSNKTDSVPVTPAPHSGHLGVAQRSPKCPECGSTATCLAGGMRHCNQCTARW